MRVELRRLRAGELDHELIWLVVTVAAAAAGLAWLTLHLPWPVCTFRALTGLPCVTCGATRSVLAFSQGDLGAAWRLNPLIFAGICSVVVFDVYALAVLCSGARRVRISLPRSGIRRLLIAVVAIAGAANWIYLLRQ
jgi:hypothetical protein